MLLKNSANIRLFKQTFMHKLTRNKVNLVKAYTVDNQYVYVNIPE